MGLIARSIPSLFNGVSQQPAQLRNASQCEDMVNAYPSIATGLRKRPPTKHLAKLRNTAATDAFVHVVNRDVDSRYIVVVLNGDLEVYTIDGTPCTVTFPDGKGYLAATTPRESFAAVSISDYTIIVNRTKTVALTADVSAGTLAGSKQVFSLLATPATTNEIWKIEGDPSNSFDNYYVKDTGTWVEWVKPGIKYRFDAATMPHQLVRTGPTTFEFRKATWAERTIGDETSNPAPSFVGKTLKDVFLFRNRLGFIAEENIVLSRPGTEGYFNFWAETATAVLDTDPIDVSVTHTKVSNLNFAVVFNSDLMLFSDQTQFQLSGGDVLTPRTAKIDPVTEFESSPLCRPVTAGQEVFFPQPRGQYTAIRDYYIDTDAMTNDAADISAHVPSYIPAGVFQLDASTSEDVLFALTLGERNSVYCYKYYWAKEEKVQSSWGRLSFDEIDVILAVKFINQAAYFVIQRADGVYLEVMDMQANLIDEDLSFLVHLDRKVALTGTYDPAERETTWTLPYEDSADIRVVVGPGFTGKAGSNLTVTRPSSTTVVAAGDWSAAPCYVGRSYEMRYRFSELYIKDDRDVAVSAAIVKLRRMMVTYSLSGYFRAEVTPKYRQTYTYRFTGKVLGSHGLVLGQPSLESGTFRFPILCDNLGCVIELVNDSPFPSIFQTAEWEAEFTMKSARA